MSRPGREVSVRHVCSLDALALLMLVGCADPGKGGEASGGGDAHTAQDSDSTEPTHSEDTGSAVDSVHTGEPAHSGDPTDSGETGDSTAPDDSGGGADSGEVDPGDIEIPFSGDTTVAIADVTVIGDTRNMDLGRTPRIGDITGDGIDDLVSGLLLIGSTTGGGAILPGPITTSGDTGTLGYQVSGVSRSSGTGRATALGDVDGDGYLDLGLGAPYAGADNGLHVNLGPITGEVDAGVDDGVRLIGPSGTYAGHGADLGDVDGDGLTDALTGAYYAEGGRGVTYVSYGPVTADRTLDEDADARLIGESRSTYAGRIVRAGADLDGDGVGDALVAALGDMDLAASGGIYVAMGPFVGDIALEDAEGRYSEEGRSSYAGLWLDAGDVDGDGRCDAVAAARDNTLAVDAGAAYVVLGPASAHTTVADSDIIVRGDRADQYGGNVAVGDLDLDGTAELLLGAQGDPSAGPDAGAAFLFVNPSPGSYVFADGDAAFYAEGAGDNLGAGLTLGDVSADGVPDLVLGAPYQSEGGTGAGAIYVMFGG